MLIDLWICGVFDRFSHWFVDLKLVGFLVCRTRGLSRMWITSTHQNGQRPQMAKVCFHSPHTASSVGTVGCFVNNQEPAASVMSQTWSELVYLQREPLCDKSDLSKHSHSTETNFNYSTNFESAKNVRSSNVVEFEFELHDIPTRSTWLLYARPG